MKVLLTGDRGYIGTVLSKILIEKNYEVIGYDSGYFSQNILSSVKQNYKQITKRATEFNVLSDILI